MRSISQRVVLADVMTRCPAKYRKLHPGPHRKLPMLPTRITLKGVLSGQLIGIPSSSVSWQSRSEEHTSELQSHLNLVCRLLLEKKKEQQKHSNRPRQHGQPAVLPTSHVP